MKIYPRQKIIPTKAIQPIKNRGWHQATAGSTVIVFVHGLLSSSETCWKSENGAFWPDIVLDDSAFAGAGIYLGGYHTKIDSGIYDVAQCSRELFDGLQFDTAKGRVPLEHPQMVFVAHSLGGIIVRRMLEEKASAFEHKRIGLVLMASPTLGSSYANILKPLTKLYGHRMGQQLKTDDLMLADIDHRFRALLESKRIPNLSGTEACEHHGLVRFKFLPFRMKPIVSPSSSSRYFGSPKIIPDTDHSSIVKPTSEAHESHSFLRNYYASNFGPEVLEATKASDHLTAAHILFDVYNAQAEPYCIWRNVDKDLAALLPIKSVWLVGPSGSGKTTIVKRYLQQNNLHPLEAMLGHLYGDLKEDRLTIELIETLNTRDNTTRPETFSSVVDALSSTGKKQRVVLFLDELPISALDEHQLSSLLRYLSSLMEATKKKSGPDVQFVFCSIDAPSQLLITSKLQEQIQILKIEKWTAEELHALARVINLTLPQLQPDASLQERIVASCDGTPRLLKAFYKRRLIVDRSKEKSVESYNTALLDFPQGQRK